MPGDAAVNRPAACPPAGVLLQRHAAFQGGLQASELLEDLDRALKDRPLDPGKFLTDPGVGLAGVGRLSPAAHHGQGPVHLPRSAGDGDDLDGPALVFERVPEPAVRRSPRTERGRGVVAGIDVDEHCTARVQCDRQLEREAGINLRKSRWDNDLATRCGLRVSHGVSERRKSRYPLGLREKHAETERSGGSAAARSRAEDVA